MDTASRSTERPRPRLRPGLRLLFTGVGLVGFALALGGMFVVRIYDDQLVRQTESELIAQGAVVGAAWKAALAARVPELAARGRAAAPAAAAQVDPASPYRPIKAQLHNDADHVRPRAPDAVPPEAPADDAARAAGAAIEPIMRSAAEITLAGMRVVDDRGVVVATTREETGLSLADREEVARALRGEPASLLRRRSEKARDAPYGSLSRNTGVRVFVALPVTEAGRVLGAVVLSRTPMTLGNAFYADRWNLATTASVLLAAVLVVSLLAATLIVRPLRALVRQTEAIAAGRADGAAPLRRPITIEVAALSEALARMAQQLGERAETIRNFAAAVSHEFKTPLTAMRGAVELLRDHGAEMSGEDRARFLANLEGDTHRLDQLVRRLLELARADALGPPQGATDARAALARAAARAEAAGLEARLEPAPAPLAVRIDADTLDTVLANLVDNARTHAGPAATVTLGARRDAERVTIEVSDDGPGVSPGNAGRLFQPFFTTARDAGGTGLGLAIARALARGAGGDLSLVAPGGEDAGGGAPPSVGGAAASDGGAPRGDTGAAAGGAAASDGGAPRGDSGAAAGGAAASDGGAPRGDGGAAAGGAAAGARFRLTLRAAGDATPG